MRLGVSTACFYPQPLEEILPVLSGMGVRAAEIFFNTESEFEPRFYERLGAQAAQLGLDIVSIHPYTSLMEGLLFFSDYRRRLEDGLTQYRRYFACAAALGARCLTFHGERDMGPPDTPERWARKCAAYRRLCALADEYGVKVAQENVAWCRSRHPDYIRALYRDVPELRYTLDIKQAHRAGQDWRVLMDAMGDRLINVHINDFSKEQSCMLPCSGMMDYTAFFSRMHRLGYDGHALVEVYRSNFGEAEELRRSVCALSRFVPR
ncbi:MAG: sugar phosphate isomerase/epimerase family protein [Agathobaculum sp.]|uniref:sugar phosphate isomerase/epimerase family protein n=1 Tax=Agathobaculum sp. TaxID=2048138 RepID=UPI003D93B063